MTNYRVRLERKQLQNVRSGNTVKFIKLGRNQGKIREGGIYPIMNLNNFMLEIIDCSPKSVDRLTDAEIADLGYSSRESFIQNFYEKNPNLTNKVEPRVKLFTGIFRQL